MKSAKGHLIKLLNSTYPTYEEMNTMIIRVEMCLNSRPISQLSENATDLQILTPGHFLTGEHLQDIPEDDLKEIPDSKLKRFQFMKKRFQLFWKRWSTEYLTQLQLRTNKGSKSPMEIKLDQLVVIKEDNLPPTEWAVGRIVALHPINYIKPMW